MSYFRVQLGLKNVELLKSPLIQFRKLKSYTLTQVLFLSRMEAKAKSAVISSLGVLPSVSMLAAGVRAGLL